MAANETQCPELEQSSIIKFLVAKKCKPCEIYRMCREACFSKTKKYLQIG